MDPIKRILVVEDSPTQGELVTVDLQSAGFTVTLAANAADALECLAARPYDLVLSDVVMPGMDGYELCRRIKDDHRELPVVLLTSLTDPLEIVHGLEAGADNFLRKPYDAGQLVERIRTMLYHRSMRASGRASIGLEVMLHDQRFLITAERQQILDLLISSFEDLVASNRQLRERELALVAADERLRAQLQATEDERHRMSAVLGAAPNAMAIVDVDGRLTDASDRLCSLLERDREELLGRLFVEEVRFVDGDGRPVPVAERPARRVLETGRPITLGEDFNLFVEGPNGTTVAIIASAAPVLNSAGQTIAVVGVLHEIGALAGHDAVTKLPNQSLFADRVRLAIGTGAHEAGHVAVVGIVVDRYARLSERLAPVELDELLGAFASFMGSALARASSDIPLAFSAAESVGYLGNGVFGVLLSDVEDELSAGRVSRQLIDSMSAARFTVGGTEIHVSASAGIALADDGDSEVDLVASVVRAALKATASGPGATVTDAHADAEGQLEDWLRQEADLRRALDEGELVAHYQPEIGVRAGRPFGVEALVRWQHPERGLLLPQDFLPLAAEADLIADIGWQVLDAACRQTAQWRATLPGAERMTVSVNFDSSQLDDPLMTERVRQILADADLTASALVIEITETGMTKNPDVAAERLRELKVLGAHLAIDDFGTGHSSLVSLRQFPVDALKIDRSFVAGMSTEPEDAAIVAATVRLGQALGLTVVAEGVETEDELVQLRLLGCDAAQGYYWTRALAPDDLAAWWADRRETELPAAVTAASLGDDASNVDDVVSHLVHELRTPLAVVSGYARLLLERGDPEGKFIEPIVRNAEDLDRRLAMLAEMRLASHGLMNLSLDEHDLGELVEVLTEDVTPQLAPHPVVVEVEPVTARVDATRVGQILTNLLTNAAKFSPAEAAISVTLTQGRGTVRLAVSDRGPGVPPERRPELFRRFARLGSRQKGMGIGLYLVRSIARAHGGEVHYEETPGGGATFVVLLPAS